MRNNVDTDFLLHFGNNLKKIRELKGYTQAQLSIDCDFDISVISRIERGVVNTSLNNIRIISQALEIDIKELFDFEMGK